MRKFYTSDNGFIEKNEPEPRCWISVECPDEEDLLFLQRELCVPESFLESAADADERPRFDRDGDWLLTILRVPRHIVDGSPDDFDTVTLAVMTKGDLLVTICHNKTEMLDDFIADTRKRHIIAVNKPDFILRLMYSATYWFLNYLREMDRTVVNQLADIQHDVRNEDLYRLMRIQKSLVYFNTAIKGDTTLVSRVNKMFDDECDPDLLEDVEIELQQAQNTADIYIEILDSTMDTLTSVVSNNVNEIMKKMTSISIILMLPTLIASFYGMNVAVAFGSGGGAFWKIIAFSIGLALLSYLLLRRIRWI